MNSDTKALVVVLVIIGIVFGGIFLLMMPTYFLLPTLLNNSSKDAISILSTYKLALTLFYVVIIVYAVSVIAITIYFSTKIAPKKIIAPRMVRKVYIIIILFSGIAIFFINDSKENFEAYSKVSSDLEQYKSGDVTYTNVMIYLDDQTEEFEKGAMLYLSGNYESEVVFDSIKTFDPEATDEDFEGVNKGVTRFMEMFTYYLLPENVDFDESEVQRVAYYDRDNSDLDTFYESLEPLYESNAVYKVGHTDNYDIIYSIEKVN